MFLLNMNETSLFHLKYDKLEIKGKTMCVNVVFLRPEHSQRLSDW